MLLYNNELSVHYKQFLNQMKNSTACRPVSAFVCI